MNEKINNGNKRNESNDTKKTKPSLDHEIQKLLEIDQNPYRGGILYEDDYIIQQAKKNLADKLKKLNNTTQENNTPSENNDISEIEIKGEKDLIDKIDIADKITNKCIDKLIDSLTTDQNSTKPNSLVDPEIAECDEFNTTQTLDVLDPPVQVKNPKSVNLHPHEARYANDIAQRERMSEINQRLTGSVLDVGAAGKYNPGIFTREFAKNHPIAAIDENEETISRFIEINPQIPIINANAKNLKINDHSFDTVLLGNILQFHNEPGRIIDEAMRIKRKKVVITLPLSKTNYPGHKFETRAKVCHRNGKPTFVILEFINIDSNGD